MHSFVDLWINRREILPFIQEQENRMRGLQIATVKVGWWTEGLFILWGLYRRQPLLPDEIWAWQQSWGYTKDTTVRCPIQLWTWLVWRFYNKGKWRGLRILLKSIWIFCHCWGVPDWSFYNSGRCMANPKKMKVWNVGMKVKKSRGFGFCRRCMVETASNNWIINMVES